MNKKRNNHYRKTHEDIITFVFTLLKEKELRSITVTEVCRALSINRSTFYEHFADVYAVVDEVELRKAEELSTLFRESISFSPKQAFFTIFSYVQQNKAFYKIYMNQRKEIHFSTEAWDTSFLQDIVAANGLKFSCVPVEYYTAFFGAGINALLRKWLTNDCQESVEDMYVLYSSFLKNALGSQ